MQNSEQLLKIFTTKKTFKNTNNLHPQTKKKEVSHPNKTQAIKPPKNKLNNITTHPHNDTFLIKNGNNNTLTHRTI